MNSNFGGNSTRYNHCILFVHMGTIYMNINSLSSELKYREEWTNYIHVYALAIKITDLADFKGSQNHTNITQGTQAGITES